VEAVDCGRVHPRTAVTTVSGETQVFIYLRWSIYVFIYHSRKGRMLTTIDGELCNFLLLPWHSIAFANI
jgi:hypothetical protein